MVVRIAKDMVSEVRSSEKNITVPLAPNVTVGGVDGFTQILNSLRVPQKAPLQKTVEGEEFRQLLKAQIEIHDHSLKVNLLSRAFESIGSSVKRLQQMS
ncbi:MAG: hypothetical protein PHC51_09930 [bacterium]|nr:hypothetical protein [bacterium]